MGNTKNCILFWVLKNGTWRIWGIRYRYVDEELFISFSIYKIISPARIKYRLMVAMKDMTTLAIKINKWVFLMGTVIVATMESTAVFPTDMVPKLIMAKIIISKFNTIKINIIKIIKVYIRVHSQFKLGWIRITCKFSKWKRISRSGVPEQSSYKWNCSRAHQCQYSNSYRRNRTVQNLKTKDNNIERRLQL